MIPPGLKLPNIENIERFLKVLSPDDPIQKEWSELMRFIVKLKATEQGALSVSARTSLAYRLYRNLVQNPDYEWSGHDCDYEDEHHQEVIEYMKKLKEEL